MRRLVATLAALSLLACVSGAAAGARGGPPPFPTLPGNWSHSEINVKIKGVPHTLILDHGRIAQASPQQLTLREPDGSVVTMGLSPSTIVVIGRQTSSAATLRRGLVAETMRIDDGAAVRVRVTLRP